MKRIICWLRGHLWGGSIDLQGMVGRRCERCDLREFWYPWDPSIKERMRF